MDLSRIYLAVIEVCICGLYKLEISFHSGGPGHKRTASKTDFILPPDHDEREKKRSSLQREPQASQQTRLVLNDFFFLAMFCLLAVHTHLDLSLGPSI